MDPESKKLLLDTLALTKENNDILHAMKRSLRIQRVMTFIYWFFIIGSAVGAYYIIQPYIDQLISVYSGAGDVLDSLKN